MVMVMVVVVVVVVVIVVVHGWGAEFANLDRIGKVMR